MKQNLQLPVSTGSWKMLPTRYYRNKGEVENIGSVDVLHIVTAVVTQVTVFIAELS